MHDDEPLLESAGPAADPALRTRILGDTNRVLRRRVWGRRIARTGAMAAYFAAGVVTLAITRPTPDPVVINVIRVEKVLVEPPVQQSTEPIGPLAREMERDAEQLARAEAAKRFRQAGDRYFADEGNYDAALRCYRNYLDAAGPEELVPAPADDNWLLLALKNARLKERDDAKRDG
jgi:hypothetical protein